MNRKYYLHKIKSSLFALLFGILLFPALHFLPDIYIFNEFGKTIYLPEIVSVTDFISQPITNTTEHRFPNISINNDVADSSKFTFSTDSFISKCYVKIDSTRNYSQPYIDISFCDGKPFYNRSQKIRMYPFQKAFIAPYFGNYISQKLNLAGCKYNLVFVQLNNFIHPYFYREKYNTSLIEKQNISNGINFTIMEFNSEIESGYGIIALSSEIKIHQNFIRNKVTLLNQIISQNDPCRLSEIFDLEYMSRYFIYCHLTGRKKLSDAKWVYRQTNGKIYPLSICHKRLRRNKTSSKTSIWDYFLQLPKFNQLLIKQLTTDTLFPNLNDIDEIQELFAPTLSNFNSNINASQRGLNYNLTIDRDILLRNMLVLDNIKQSLILEGTQNTLGTPIDHSIEKIKKEIVNIGFTILGTDVIVNEGIYHIDSNLVLPIDYKLVINAGAVIKLKDSVSFIAQGPIAVNGTNTKKVIITSTETGPFGVFGSVGNQIDTSIIKHLEISNGSEAYIEGKYLSGALSFYHQNVIMRYVNCYGNNADDGLNIKYGNVIIDHCLFNNNWADQIDLDYCNGSISNSHFNSDIGNSNGDGLDLSGSKINITNSSFNNFKDKGVSIGESTIAQINNCNFSNNVSAVAIKDLSNAAVDNSIFSNNTIAFNLFVKKPFYGGARLQLGKNYFFNNTNKIISDSLSHFTYK